MGALFEFTGVVKKVNEIQRFASGFEKREIVLTDDVGVQVNFPNTLCFVFKKERMSLIENCKPGQRVKIVFAIDGREWTDNYGNTRYFTDLTGIKLEALSAVPSAAPAQVPQPATQPPEVSAPPVGNDMDDVPF